MARDVEARPAVTLADSELSEMSNNERLKVASKGLFFVDDGKSRHTFLDDIEALEKGETETLGGTAKEISKFFGVYKQQARGDRGKKTNDFFFMVRIRNPGGGRLAASQWIALDDAAQQYADGTLRITSRQAIQYHHVYGPSLGPLIRHLNRSYAKRGTLSACGDVNRNVMASPVDGLDPEHAPRGQDLATELADALAPQSTAYFQVFVSNEEGRNAGPVNSTEPLYGDHYLPRKFKIGIAHPTDGSVDVLTQDVGLVPVDSAGTSWDLYTGGGLGMTHNNPKTAPHLGLYLGRIARDDVVEACRVIVLLQKTHGERKDRKQARWKYTIRRLGVDAVKAALRSVHGIELEDAEPVPLPKMQLHLGWHDQRGGGSYYGVSVESGRLKDEKRAAVREAVETLGLSVVLTAQQDLLLCDVQDRAAVDAIFERHGVAGADQVSLVRANSMACPAKPTCGLAMTDAENILPVWCDAIEAAGLGGTDVVIRVTGCPNNCARPPSAEIGIYGYGKNDHVVLVGGSREGSRLAAPLFERLPGEKMSDALVGICRAIRDHNPEGLPAGDFLHQTDPAQLREWVGIEV